MLNDKDIKGYKPYEQNIINGLLEAYKEIKDDKKIEFYSKLKVEMKRSIDELIKRFREENPSLPIEFVKQLFRYAVEYLETVNAAKSIYNLYLCGETEREAVKTYIWLLSIKYKLGRSLLHLQRFINKLDSAINILQVAIHDLNAYTQYIN